MAVDGKGAVSRRRRVSIRAPKAIRCSRPIISDHNCVATTFLLSIVHSWAASFHLVLPARTGFCFRGVSAAGYRPRTWNLILSSRHRDRTWPGTTERGGQSNKRVYTCVRVKYGKIEKEGRGEKEKSKKGYGETHEFCYTGCPKVSGGQCKKKKKK